MTSPVGARAPAGDPFFLWSAPVARFVLQNARQPPRLPGSTPAPTGVASPVARFFDPLRPGAASPVARFLDLERDALARFLRPVARSATPLRRPPDPPPRLPGSSSPAPHRLPREGSSARIRIILHRPRFHLVNPVGPSDPFGPPCGFPQLSDTVPRVPVGVRLPVQRTLCTARFRRSTGFFCPHRVIHRLSGLTTEIFRSSTVRPQVVHR